MASKARYRRAYRFGHYALGYPCQWLYCFECDTLADLPEPALIVCNHTMDLDFPLLMRAFPRLMHFVIGENVFQNRLLKWLLRLLHDPVMIRKGGTDGQALLEIMRRLRQGQNLCIFPEGNTCFDGVTGPVPRGTGALIRAARAHLVTYRLHGGYLSKPRWGLGIRRGRTWGALQGVYAPDALSAMSDEEVNALIARDLRVDAFEDQAAAPVRYRSSGPARGLEHALYWCPRCGAMDALASEARAISCGRCGLRVGLREDGFFAPGSPYAQPRDWVAAQRRALADRLREDPALRLSDPGQRLSRVMEDDSTRPIAEGAFSMDRHGLSIGAFRLGLQQLQGLAIYRRNRLLISDRQGRRFQLDSIRGQNALKYRDLYQILTAR